MWRIVGDGVLLDRPVRDMVDSVVANLRKNTRIAGATSNAHLPRLMQRLRDLATELPRLRIRSHRGKRTRCSTP